METIKEKIQSKPSIALEKMLIGLEQVKNQDNCQVSMAVFGIVEDGICFKCAATTTIEVLFNHVFTPDEIDFRHNRFSAVSPDEYDDLFLFEDAMNSARLGELNKLFNFCDLTYDSEFNYLISLQTHNWQKELPKVYKLVEKLKAVGY